MNNDEFLAELRGSVVAADEAHRAQRSRRGRQGSGPVRWLAAAAIVLVVAGASVALRPSTAAAGLQVVADSTGITLRLTDLATRPSEVERASKEAGLDVTVSEVPVGPSMVGKFVGLSGEQLPQRVQVTDGDASSGFTAFRLPAGFDGPLELRMGRAARDGETWAVLSDATAPGEPLACQDLVGEDLADVMAVAAESDVGQVLVMSLDSAQWLDRDGIDASANAEVIRVMRRSEDVLVIDAAQDPTPFRRMSPPPPEGC